MCEEKGKIEGAQIVNFENEQGHISSDCRESSLSHRENKRIKDTVDGGKQRNNRN